MSENYLRHSKETVKRVRAEFGLDERSIKEAVDTIKEWMKSQPHLPNVDDDNKLERWLIRCKNNLERTKHSIDMYYALKTTTPELMSGWDTTSKWFKSITDVIYYVPMPQLTPNCNRVIVFGFQTPDATNFIPEDLAKVVLMTFEILSCEDYYFSIIVILDLSNYTAGHVSKLTITSTKKCDVCSTEGYNTRIKAIHIITKSPYAESIIWLLKSVLKTKHASRIYTHNDLTSLWEQVPQECLPKEYGGEAGSIPENWSLWKKKLESYQNWYQENENLKSDEEKRPGGVIDIDKYFGFDASFRKLNLD